MRTNGNNQATISYNRAEYIDSARCGYEKKSDHKMHKCTCLRTAEAIGSIQQSRQNIEAREGFRGEGSTTTKRKRE